MEITVQVNNLRGFKKIEGFVKGLKPSQIEMISQQIPEAEALLK